MKKKDSLQNGKRKPVRAARRIRAILLAAVLCLTAAGILPAGSTETAAAETQAAVAAIPVRQTVLHGSGTFAYELTAEDADAPKPDQASLSLTDTQDGSFTVSSSTPGTWYYALKIIKSSDSRYSYDVSEYRVGVRFYNDGGSLKTEVLAQAADPESDYKAQAAHFTISRRGSSGGGGSRTVTPGTVTVEPAVVKAITGDTPETDTTFQFTITGKGSAASYMPAVSAGSSETGAVNGTKTVIINGAGSRKFGYITFDRAGTYEYTVKEVQGSSAGYTYDTSSYTIRYTVTGSGSSLTAAKAVLKEGSSDTVSDSETVTFTNTYKKPEENNRTGVGDPSVTKTIESVRKDSAGNPVRPTAASGFHFTLSPYDDADKASYPMPAGSSGGELTVTITGEGSHEFGDIHFSEPGTYYYKITENKENAAGYTYDETVFKIRYVVTEEENGLQVTRTMYRVDQDRDVLVRDGSDDVVFRNEYTAPDSSGRSGSSGTSSSGSGRRTSDGGSYANPSGSGTGSADSARTAGTASVRTGDTAEFGRYLGMLIGAGAVLIILAVLRKKRDDGASSAG